MIEKVENSTAERLFTFLKAYKFSMEITLKNMKKELDADNIFGVELRNFKDSIHNIENLVSDLDEYLCLVNNCL